MPISLPSPLRRRGVLIATGTAVILALGCGTGAAFAAGTDTSTPSASSAAKGDGFFKDMPAALKADLQQLRKDPKGSDARKTDWQKIVTEAHNGDFGQRYYYIGRLLHREHRAAVLFGERFAKLPTNLQSDLKTLRGLTPKSAERKAERQKIESNALSGAYGDAIKARAEKRQERMEQRQATPTPSASTGS